MTTFCTPDTRVWSGREGPSRRHPSACRTRCPSDRSLTKEISIKSGINKCIDQLDLAFNNVKPMDWYFVLDLVRFRTGLGYARKTNHVELPHDVFKYLFIYPPLSLLVSDTR